MTRQMKVFSIERARAKRDGRGDRNGNGQGNGAGPRAGNAPPMAPMADEHHREILAAINALRADLRVGGVGLQEPEPIESETLEVEARSEIDQEQVSAIKRELIGIEEAIERTKKELATLHNNKLAGDRFVGVTDELDEVVKGTERATDSILESAEIIENDARNLA